MSNSEQSLKNMAVSAVKMASAALKKFRSERSILKEALAEVTQKNAASNKEARLRDIAMQLVLDEHTINSINEKAASLKDENLEVVEAAIKLNIQKKMASIGDVEESSTDDSTEGSKSAEAMFIGVLENK